MRLIDADALERQTITIENEWHIHGIISLVSHHEDVEIVNGDAIDAAPTIDPVRHGKWEVAGNTTHYYTCSVCGKPGDGFDNYCRGCGAKMDADADADGKR